MPTKKAVKKVPKADPWPSDKEDYKPGMTYWEEEPTTKSKKAGKKVPTRVEVMLEDDPFVLLDEVAADLTVMARDLKAAMKTLRKMVK